jgi:D,D-heptose 1,7-bisphosphate phosphatase
LRAAFLDRDGTLIADPGYTGDPEVVEILPGVPEALKKLTAHGYRLVIVTNQSAIARGYATAEQVEAVNQRVVDRLALHGAAIDAVYYCPHHPDDGCACRKPRPGMLLRAAEELRVDLHECVMIGDKISDVEAGTAAGCRVSVLISHDGKTGANTARDLSEAVDRIVDG